MSRRAGAIAVACAASLSIAFWPGRAPGHPQQRPAPVIEEIEDLSPYDLFRREVFLRDLTADGRPEVIAVASIRMKEGHGPPLPHTYVDVFQLVGTRAVLIHRVGVEALKGIEFLDANADRTDDLVITGVFGAHGHFLNVVTFSDAGPGRPARARDLWKEVNAHGVLLERDRRHGVAIRSGLPPARSNWSYADPHPWARFVWRGAGFVFDRIVE